MNKFILIKPIAFFFHITYWFFNRMYWLYKYSDYRFIYDVHSSFRFNGQNILLYGKGKILLGENSYIGHNSILASLDENKRILIGENCSISHYFTAYTRSRIPNQDFSKFPHRKESGNIIIGNNCWIGIRVFVKHGVKIGSNCVIGANTSVTKDVPNNCIAVGNPMKIIKMKDRE